MPTRRRRLSTHLVGLLLVLGACQPAPSAPSSPTGSATSTAPPGASPSATAPAPSAAATADRVAGWRADLESIVPGMDRRHPNLTHGTSREDLDAAVTDLIATVPTATDDELMVGVLRIVAMVSADGCDAHTGAFIWGTGSYPVDSLPLRLWLFPFELADAMVVVDALPPYEDLIGSVIDTVEGTPELDVRMQLGAIIPRDNDSTFRLLVPRYVLMPQVLRGLGVAGDDPITLEVTTPAGDPRTVDITPIPMAAYNDWAGEYGLHLPADPDVPYLSRIDDALWWALQPDGETLFVQYNRVDRLPAAMREDLQAALGRPGLTRIVLDLRHNYGGEVSALNPILERFDDPAVDQPGRLFVITGRNTFSAASLLVARLDARTDATIVGEPMGGCPTLYGDATDFDLPYSGITVNVATELSVGVDPADPRQTIEPDIPIPLTLDDWIHGSDPALGSIATFVP